MDPTRHKLTRETLNLPEPVSTMVDSAESLETSGNWYGAAELYRDAAEQAIAMDAETRAKLLVRAAGCFDIARQDRAAARAYFDAASELYNSGVRFQAAGELFNRAALLFRAIGEYFNAGDTWRRAGAAFAKVSELDILTLDNIPPVPGGAGKFAVAGECYTAGGDAFLLAGDNAAWACMSYWEAAKSHSTQGHGYHAFVAYRKALTAAARFYGTHDRGELRRCLPLTESERAAKLDPLAVMEDEAYRGYCAHQQMNTGIYKIGWARAETDRQMRAAFHEFYLTFSATGNGREAGLYRAAERNALGAFCLLTAGTEQQVFTGSGRKPQATAKTLVGGRSHVQLSYWASAFYMLLSDSQNQFLTGSITSTLAWLRSPALDMATFIRSESSARQLPALKSCLAWSCSDYCSHLSATGFNDPNLAVVTSNKETQDDNRHPSLRRILIVDCDRYAGDLLHR